MLSQKLLQNPSLLRTARRGLTLMELVVVMFVLVALAALLIPRIGGITDKAGNATSAAILQGINEAEGRYEAQFNQIPWAWDGVLNSTGTLYSKLNPKLTGQLDAAGTQIVPGTLSAMQYQSLVDASPGLSAFSIGIHFQDESWTGAPSDSGRLWQQLASGSTVATLQLPTSTIQQGGAGFDTYGHNVLFSDRAFSIQPFTNWWSNTFVVFGFGNESNLKRNSVQDTPVFASAGPQTYYARGLVVFMVPNSSVASTTDAGYFKARYIGSFAPDGTCIMDNTNSFNQGQVAQ